MLRRVRTERASGGGGDRQSGTGVGFSVEKAQTEQLPVVAMPNADAPAPPVLVVEDSKRGWAEGLRALVAALYAGQTPQWDLSKLRPAGARLVTMGGRASGPDPLNDLFTFTTATFHGAAGRQLTPMECHDLMCKVGARLFCILHNVCTSSIRAPACASCPVSSESRECEQEEHASTPLPTHPHEREWTGGADVCRTHACVCRWARWW